MAEGKRLSRLAQRARALDSGPGALKAAQAAHAKGAPKDLQVFSVKPRAAD